MTDDLMLVYRADTYSMALLVLDFFAAREGSPARSMLAKIASSIEDERAGVRGIPRCEPSVEDGGWL